MLSPPSTDFFPNGLITPGLQIHHRIFLEGPFIKCMINCLYCLANKLHDRNVHGLDTLLSFEWLSSSWICRKIWTFPAWQALGSLLLRTRAGAGELCLEFPFRRFQFVSLLFPDKIDKTKVSCRLYNSSFWLFTCHISDLCGSTFMTRSPEREPVPGEYHFAAAIC